MGDASGKGYNLGIWNKDRLAWESGNYMSHMPDDSSNFQKADNLVMSIEGMAGKGSLD